jgi:hypothetical protein
MYCPNCQNILDISIKPFRQENSVNLTDTNDNNDDDVKYDINNIVDKILNKDELTKDEINFVSSIEKSNKIYEKLSKTDKKKLDDYINFVQNSYQNINQAYNVCLRCFYSNEIEEETLILTKKNDDVIKSYFNEDILKNAIHDKTLFTRTGIVCKNDMCLSHTNNEKRQCVFIKINMEIWYVCKECTTYWKNE